MDCSNNYLSTLDIRANAALTKLICSNNNFDAATLRQIIADLPVIEQDGSPIVRRGGMDCKGNPGSAALTEADVQDALDKNWTLTYQEGGIVIL